MFKGVPINCSYRDRTNLSVNLAPVSAPDVKNCSKLLPSLSYWDTLPTSAIRHLTAVGKSTHFQEWSIRPNMGTSICVLPLFFCFVYLLIPNPSFFTVIILNSLSLRILEPLCPLTVLTGRTLPFRPTVVPRSSTSPWKTNCRSVCVFSCCIYCVESTSLTTNKPHH